MSAAQDPGSARPGRLIGLVLMGIAAIAVVLGIVTLVGGGDGDDNANPPSTTTPPGSQTTRPSEQPPGSNQSSPGQPTSQQPTQPPANPTTANPPPNNPPAPPNPRSVPVRVLNNSTTNGQAARAAADFRADGWNVAFVGNLSETQGGRIPTSTAYFRPGTDEEAAARELARKFNLKVDARSPAIANDPPGVIVIVTNDYGGK
jgi:hypothetical protein